MTRVWPVKIVEGDESMPPTLLITLGLKTLIIVIKTLAQYNPPSQRSDI